VIVRTALAGEREAVGALRVSAYESGGFLDHATGYVDTLRVLGFGGHGTILVAVGEEPGGTDPRGADPGGELLGTVMFEPWHAGSEIARAPEEAEVRALAVAPAAQGRGTGRALIQAVIDLAAASGASRLLLSTQQDMKAAQHLYRELGFARDTDLDWTPIPDVTLIGFSLPLAGAAADRGGRS
jgi:ribosomal protein S18 acetylase RimI-like enzyme